MGTYNLPRNVKGEGRILFIFTPKSLMYTAIGGGIGLVFYFIFSALNMIIAGIIIALLFAAIGFAIGTFKIPDSNGFEVGRKVGGEKIDEVIKRYIRFKRNKRKIYVYTKEEK